MKKMLILTLLWTLNAKAITLKFVGPCSKNFIMKVQVNEPFETVGKLTVMTLDKFGIPYLGTHEGLNSVFGTPVGMDAMEILSDDEMRAYGWCYSVNGISPEIFPHQMPITPETKEITWTFGFAHYYRGEWLTQCTPAHTVKPAFLCEKKR